MDFFEDSVLKGRVIEWEEETCNLGENLNISHISLSICDT